MKRILYGLIALSGLALSAAPAMAYERHDFDRRPDRERFEDHRDFRREQERREEQRREEIRREQERREWLEHHRR
jgi:hypothetical protein